MIVILLLTNVKRMKLFVDRFLGNNWRTVIMVMEDRRVKQVEEGRIRVVGRSQEGQSQEWMRQMKFTRLDN